MNRRDTVLALLVLGATPLTARTQQTAPKPRVGILGVSGSLSPLEMLRAELQKRGYVDGRDIVFEDKSRLDGYDQLDEAAVDLVRSKVDIIATWGDVSTQAARKATTTIPIVMLASSDPVARGFAATLARPGGNVTGMALLGSELNVKRLELLKEIIPGLRRVAILLAAASSSELESMRLVQSAGDSLKLQIYPAEVRAAEEIATVFAAMAQQRVGGFVALPSTMLLANVGQIVELAAKQKLPGMFPGASWATAGGLVSYAPSINDIVIQAAAYVQKILNGAKPADLPIEQPRKIELVINLKTAKTIGIKIPQSILARADRVIE
jgi:putative ABC transport system substrate-binding protein